MVSRQKVKIKNVKNWNFQQKFENLFENPKYEISIKKWVFNGYRIMENV